LVKYFGGAVLLIDESEKLQTNDVCVFINKIAKSKEFQGGMT